MELDFTKPENLQTRDGRQVRIYATGGDGVLCIHGAFKSPEGRWIAWQWTLLGKAFVTMADCAIDLIPKPARVTGWQNAYPPTRCVIAYKTREEAIKYAAHDCLGQIYIDAEIQP